MTFRETLIKLKWMVALYVKDEKKAEEMMKQCDDMLKKIESN